MHKTLQDFIRYKGAPTALKSDNALTQIGIKTREILCLYNIRDFRCKPHNQQQNPAERRIQDIAKEYVHDDHGRYGYTS